MEKIEFNAHVPGDFTVREGKALEVFHPKALNIVGMLSAPFEFLQSKKESGVYGAYHSHLLVDKENETLTLVLNEKDEKSRDTITGKLSVDPQLSKWHINSGQRWTVPTLLQFIRERKFFFADPADHDKLIKSLQKWHVNVEREIKKFNDNSGNSLDSLETKVASVEGLVSKFVLEIPIFKGYPKEKFTVEIGLDPKSTQVDIFLFSDELFELTITRRNAIFETELYKFISMGFDCSVINIS